MSTQTLPRKIMTNNEVFQHIRYIFALNADKLAVLFTHAQCPKSEEDITNYLRKNGEFAFSRLSDSDLASFLDGLIIQERGKRAGYVANLTQEIDNNIVFNKIKIALALKADDIISVMQLGELTLSKHELSAFFRKTTHKHYRRCTDATLLAFFNGLHLTHRQAISDIKE